MPIKKRRLQLPLSKDGVSFSPPVLTIASPKPGATVVITANLHGDEVTGLSVAQMLIKAIPDELVCGKVVIYPTINPDGLAKMSRLCHGQDINRLFPGDALGSPAERSARIFWDDINRQHPDLLIDIHADSPISIPYTIVDRAIAAAGEQRSSLENRTELLAQATGYTVLREYVDKQYANYNLHRSLSGAVCNKLLTPSLTIEAGPRLYTDHETLTSTYKSVMSVLGTIGVTQRRPFVHPTKIKDGKLRRSPGPKPTKTGVFHFTVSPGDQVTKGTAIAEIRNLLGETLEVLRSAGNAYVIALPERMWAKSGVAVGTFAVKDQ